jgi:hypothetical protein
MSSVFMMWYGFLIPGEKIQSASESWRLRGGAERLRSAGIVLLSAEADEAPQPLVCRGGILGSVSAHGPRSSADCVAASFSIVLNSEDAEDQVRLGASGPNSGGGGLSGTKSTKGGRGLDSAPCPAGPQFSSGPASTLKVTDLLRGLPGPAARASVLSCGDINLGTVVHENGPSSRLPDVSVIPAAVPLLYPPRYFWRLRRGGRAYCAP